MNIGFSSHMRFFSLSPAFFVCGTLFSLPLPLAAQVVPAAAPAQIATTGGGPAEATPAVPGVTTPLDSSDDVVPVTPRDYRLAPDDQVEISVQGHDDFTKTVTVLQDGTFNYFQKTYKAAGMTQDELTQKITLGLKRQLKRPQVTVSIQETHARKISIIGSRSPGQYAYKPGIKLLDLITLSGGPAQAPEQTRATLVTDNGTRNQTLDLVRLMSHDTDPSLNVPLHPGDLIIMEARPAEVSMVQVSGQIGRPGQYPVPTTGMTLMALLTLAGGAAGDGALSRTQIVHDGTLRVVNLHSTLYNVESPEANIRVYAGDAVHVPRNNDRYYVIGDIAQGIRTIPDGETWTLSMVVMAGGGIPDWGDKRSVQIAREGPGGKMVTQNVNLEDIIKANNKTVDPVIRPGDIVYVPRRHQKPSVLGTFQNAVGTVFTFSALKNLLHAGL